MIQRELIMCEDCGGVGTWEFVEFGSPSCQACAGWGEVCGHCGQPYTRCEWQVSRLECQPLEESLSPPAPDGPDFRRYNELAQATNKKASPEAGE